MRLPALCETSPLEKAWRASFQCVGNPIMVGHNTARMPIGAEVSSRAKGENSGLSQSTHVSTMVSRQMRLRAIFYHPELVFSCNVQDGVHLCRLAVQMHRNNANSGFGDFSPDVLRVDRESFLVGVAKHDPRARLLNRLDGCDPAMRRGDHFRA